MDQKSRRQARITASLSHRIGQAVLADVGVGPAQFHHSRNDVSRIARAAGLPVSAPGTAQVTRAVIPPPPFLPRVEAGNGFGPNRADERRRLLVAYRGACEMYWPGSGATKVLIRGNPSAKTQALLDAAADVMADRMIAPAAWTWFSVDDWQRIRPGGGPPTLAWVFAKTRTTKQRWRYRRDATKYEAGRLRPCPITLELYYRVGLFLDRLRAHKTPGMAEAVQEFDRVCPDWDEMVQTAHVNAIEANRRVRERIASGAWVWTAVVEPMPGWIDMERKTA